MTQSTPPSNKLETEPVGKLLWQYAVPAIVGTMVMSLYTIIDRIFIGQGVGPDAISGLALTFPIMNLTAAVGMLVGAGVEITVVIRIEGYLRRRKFGDDFGNRNNDSLARGRGSYVAQVDLRTTDALEKFHVVDTVCE